MSHKYVTILGFFSMSLSRRLYKGSRGGVGFDPKNFLHLGNRDFYYQIGLTNHPIYSQIFPKPFSRILLYFTSTIYLWYMYYLVFRLIFTVFWRNHTKALEKSDYMGWFVWPIYVLIKIEVFKMKEILRIIILPSTLYSPFAICN